MTRKVQLAFIVNAAKRKATCKKRTRSLMKMMNELGTLCGVDVCGIVHSNQLSPPLQFWPNKSEAQRIAGKFESLPGPEKTKNMVDLKIYLRKSISKVNTKLRKLQKANRQMELTNIMFDYLAGRSELPDRGLEDMEALGRVVDHRIDEIEERIKSLMLNNLNQPGASTSNVGGALGNE